MGHGGHGGGLAFPGVPPLDDTDPYASQLAEAMGALPIQMQRLRAKQARAQSLIGTPSAQGAQVGHTFVAASPFEHLATGLQRAMGYQQARQADEEMGPLAQQAEAAGRSQFRMEHAPAPSGWGAPAGMTRGEALKVLPSVLRRTQAAPYPDALLVKIASDHNLSGAEADALRDRPDVADAMLKQGSGAAIKAGTPHGRQWAEVNWTNPVTGAQDRHLLNMLDGSRWALDGVTQLSPPIRGWAPPAGAAEQPATSGHAGHGAPTPTGAAPQPSTPATQPNAPASAAAPAPKRLGAPKPAGPRFSNTPAGQAAKAIYEGRQPPDLKNQRYAAGVRQELDRAGFDLVEAQNQWTAMQRNLAAVNSTQQTRLRQAIGSAPHMLDNIETLFKEWESLGMATRYKVVNRATLSAAKNTGGREGEVAQALEANIADLVSDLATIYQGGNTPTEHSMKLALENLSANWNPGQFREAIKQVRNNINYRRAAMDASGPVGTGGENRYGPQAPTPGDSTAPAPDAAAALRSKYGL